MRQSFEQFCQMAYMAEYPQTLDDELSDKVDAWLGELSSEQLYELAEVWREQREGQ